MQTISTRYGRMLCPINDEWVGQSLFRFGEFSQLEVDFLKQLIPRGSVVMDIGANIGALTLPFSKFVGPKGRVYAFEPLRPNFLTLCGSLAFNEINNVEPFHAAVGNAEGEVPIAEVAFGQAANYGGYCIREYPEGIDVPLIMLDTWFPGHCPNPKALRLIKVDVEGMELDVVNGAEQVIREFRPVLYLEADRKDKVVALLTRVFELGYRIWWHAPPLFNPDNWAGEDDPGKFKDVVSFNVLCLPAEARANIEGLVEVRSPDGPLPEGLGS